MTDIPGCLTDIFSALFSGHEQLAGLINIYDENYTATDNLSLPQLSGTLVSAFLVGLCGESHPKYSLARNFLHAMSHHETLGAAAQFLVDGHARLSRELSQYLQSNTAARDELNDIACAARDTESRGSDRLYTRTRDFFFPEGAFWPDETATAVKELRKKRTIAIDELNTESLKDIAAELIFTSNVLLTVPSEKKDGDELDLEPELSEQIRAAAEEKQRFWFDHPIQIGVEAQHNEVLYGLSMLNRSLKAEAERGNLSADQHMRCVLSVSVTHEGLRKTAGPYLESLLNSNDSLDMLDVFIFTEDDTRAINDDVLRPLARRYGLSSTDYNEIFGVDGEYGRHYSFLKAVAAVWQVFVDHRVRATFKIDLDQVFPQQELIAETGKSALEHLMSPLWGAGGTDFRGRKVHLGMFAGALVNESDIGRGLFTPDVTYPAGEISADALVFNSKLPQALSTETEMMARYGGGSETDGKKTCIQRVHVTGGTNGILVKSLRRFRPFTPSFIGRAEDQAYLMSVLFDEKDGALLRYVHASGLIMRHDKEAFAADAIEAAGTGKAIGDYIRMLLFSEYARLLPGGAAAVKDEMGPFTGCFVSPIPRTITLLRFALSSAWRLKQGETGALDFFLMGADRIGSMMSLLDTGDPSFMNKIQQEREAWNNFFDLLDMVEGELHADNDTILTCQKKLLSIVCRCRMRSC